ncbi:MAG: phage major capsid protein [Burkholderiaceae bacterium]|nr:phage major capsid protein [Burkholderiaceae bacterium]
MSDLSQIHEAIETANRAFEAFKGLNDQRLQKLEQGEAGFGDKLAAMHQAFDEMLGVKASIDALEARMNRPAYLRKGSELGLRELESKAYAASTGGGADGGYAIPKVIDRSIETLAINLSPIRSIASVQEVVTPDFHKLVNVRGTGSGWVGEVAARPATSTSGLADIKPPMGELYANPQATQQMLDDVFFDAEQWLAEEVAIEFARAEGAAFIVGDGVNKPSGFLAGTTATTDDATRNFGVLQHVVTGVAGGFPATNPADVLIALVGKMKAAYRANARFVMSKALLFEVASFKDTSGRYIFNPISAPGVPQTLMNYPILEAEDMPAKAANSLSIAFGDFRRGYLIVDRIGTRVIRDPFSNKPYVGFYTVKRLGGALINSEAIKVLKFAA